MKPGPGYKAWRCIYLCILVLLAPTTGLSIILHDDNQPTEPDRPPNAIVGRWSYNASFVVVSPKWILTTRHQGTSPATVDVNGVIYNCIYNSQWVGGGPTNNADIRLIRLKNTNGSDPNLAYAVPYTTADEISKPMVIGGYGRGRETVLQTQVGSNWYTYGYTWGTGVNYNNNTQRWCTNIIDGNDVAFDNIRTSEVITARFNDPGATQYEGTPAEYDSGGGWFIKAGSVWKTAGLTRGVEPHPNDSNWPAKGESWYRYPPDPRYADPDYMDAVRISSYAAWINTIITADCNGPGPVQGDLNGDCKVDMLDFARLANWWLRTNCGSGNSFCNGADFQPDGDVDMTDLAFFAQNWLADKSL